MSQYLWLFPHFPPCFYPQPLPPRCWALPLPFPKPDPIITWAILATSSLGSWFSSGSLDSRCSLCSLSHSHLLSWPGPLWTLPDSSGYPFPPIYNKPSPRPNLEASMSSLFFFHQIPSRGQAWGITLLWKEATALLLFAWWRLPGSLPACCTVSSLFWFIRSVWGKDEVSRLVGNFTEIGQLHRNRYIYRCVSIRGSHSHYGAYYPRPS